MVCVINRISEYIIMYLLYNYYIYVVNVNLMNKCSAYKDS